LAGLARPFDLPKIKIGGNTFPKGAPKEILLPDRFFFGGPLQMRGWGERSVGPMHQGDALGGDLLLASGVHLTSSVPYLDKYNVRAHFFANTGNVVQIGGNEPLLQPI
jgi:outer membrane protein assembly factor BamA